MILENIQIIRSQKFKEQSIEIGEALRLVEIDREAKEYLVDMFLDMVEEAERVAYLQGRQEAQELLKVN